MTLSTDIAVHQEPPKRGRRVDGPVRGDDRDTSGAATKNRTGSGTSFVLAIIAVGLIAFAVVLGS